MKMIKYEPVHDYLIDWLDNWLGRFKFDHRKGIVRAIINFVENQKIYDTEVEKKKKYNQGVQDCLDILQRYKDNHNSDYANYPINYGTLCGLIISLQKLKE